MNRFVGPGGGAGAGAWINFNAPIARLRFDVLSDADECR